MGQGDDFVAGWRLMENFLKIFLSFVIDTVLDSRPSDGSEKETESERER